ncbi:ERCC4 domain-containing protein [bacterium]|nr:ERCC4 domain-containing protein [bacterium]
MIIQIDTREKARAIQSIRKEFERQGIRTITSKLYVGDYARIDNLTTVIDRKQNLNELAVNIIEKRFHAEIQRAHEHGVKIIFLIEHGHGINELIDVLFWINPRITESPRCISGEHLFKAMNTLTDRYGVEWQFCTKRETGKRIIKILENI